MQLEKRLGTTHLFCKITYQLNLGSVIMLLGEKGSADPWFLWQTLLVASQHSDEKCEEDGLDYLAFISDQEFKETTFIV